MSSSLAFSDFGSDDGEHSHTNGRGYSTLMDELFGDDDETASTSPLRFDEDEEPFVYDGADAPVSRASYREQLRDVLDDDADDDEIEEREVERSLVHDPDHPPMTIGDEALVSFPAATLCSMLISRDPHTPPHVPSLLRMAWRRHATCRYQPSTTLQTFSPSSPSASTSASLASPPAMSSSLPNGNGIPTALSTASHLSSPFLHRTISRLRAYTPHATSSPSATSAHSALRGISPSPVPSSFSTLSPGSSSSALPGGAAEKRDQANGHDSSSDDAREVFRWTQLRTLGTHLFARHPSNKAQAVLGAAPAIGSPTVMAANGLVCIGTESGRILVFDFKQTLKCVCGDPASGALSIQPTTPHP